MRFGQSLLHSLYDAAWLYAKRTNMRQAWSYFFVFTVFACLVSLIPAYIAMPVAVGAVKNVVQTKVPDFKATMNGGTLAVEQLAQPWTLEQEDDGDKIRIVVDTTSSSTQSAGTHLQGGVSAVLINSHQLEMYDARIGESRTQDWSNVPNFTFTKNDLVSAVNSLSQPGSQVFIAIALTLAVICGALIGNLWSLLIVTIIVFLLAKLLRRAWGMKELFTIGLYAVTLPTILGIVFAVFGLASGLVYFLALLAFMISVTLTKEKEVPVEPQQ